MIRSKTSIVIYQNRWTGVLIFLTFISVLMISCKKDYVYKTDFRTVIPLNILYHPLNNPNYVTPVIEIKINGVAENVLFDTGSEGLRLMNGALMGTKVDTDQEIVTYNYGYAPSILNIRGKVAGGNFSVGDLSMGNPIKFMRIDDTAAASSGPWASVRQIVNFDNPHFRGLNGIIGVGLRAGGSGVSSPLAQLPGNASYIVEFPKYGDLQGQVIINPHNNERSGFIMFQLNSDTQLLPNGFNSYQDRNLWGTLTYNGVPFSAPLLIDSGSPYTELYDPKLPFFGVLPKQSKIEMILAQDSLSSKYTVENFTVEDETVGIDKLTFNNTTIPKHMSFGTNLFFQYDVLFDQKNGLIGLKRKN